MSTADKIMRELDNLREEIESTKTEKAQEEGMLKSNIERLEKEFQLEDEDAAEVHLKDLEGKLEALSEQLDKRYTHLKENYKW